MKLIKLIPLLALLALMATPMAVFAEGDTPPPDSSAVVGGDTSTTITGDTSILVEEIPDGPTELQYLESINTYVTYLFGFGLAFLFIEFGRLLYRFFNMFF